MFGKDSSFFNSLSFLYAAFEKHTRTPAHYQKLRQMIESQTSGGSNINAAINGNKSPSKNKLDKLMAIQQSWNANIKQEAGLNNLNVPNFFG